MKYCCQGAVGGREGRSCGDGGHLWCGLLGDGGQRLHMWCAQNIPIPVQHKESDSKNTGRRGSMAKPSITTISLVHVSHNAEHCL